MSTLRPPSTDRVGRWAGALLAAISALTLAACASAPSTGAAPTASDVDDPLAEVTHPPLPDWTDRFAGSNPGDMRFFVIEHLMERHGLSRLMAVELQNHYRDLSRADAPGGPPAWYAEALRRARAGALESGGPELERRLAEAPFIVAFDLDETLYDQRVASPDGCHDLAVPLADGATRKVQRVPGWRAALERIAELGGVSVIFSANLDDSTWDNLRAWTVDGVAITERPDLVAAVFTNSHLVRQSKHEGPGKANPSRGRPVAEPSKDLRMFDPTLTRVILVDDNPTRIVQHANTRWFEAFDADAWCAGRDAVDPVHRAYEAAMPRVVAEIEEAMTWARDTGGTFADGYRPFTIPGRELVRFLMTGNGWSEAEAVAYVRARPELVAQPD